MCGIGEDQSVRCWGNLVAVPPSGIFVSVESYGGMICGLKDDGSLICAVPEGEYREYGEYWLPPEGRFQTFSMGLGRVGDGLACGVRPDGALQCWGPTIELLGQPGEFPLDGQFSDVEVTGSVCGVTVDRSLKCFPSEPDIEKMDVSSFSSISVGDEHACGVQENGSVQCWGGDTFGQAYSPEGTFKSVGVSRTLSCGLRTDGLVRCWGATSSR